MAGSQAAERKLIMQIAADRGLLDKGGRETLEQWLSVAPSTARLQTDLAILNELCSSHSKTDDDFDADCSQLLVAYCQDVADAAGGILGLKPARNEPEQAALKLIATALDINNARNWRARLTYATTAGGCPQGVVLTLGRVCHAFTGRCSETACRISSSSGPGRDANISMTSSGTGCPKADR